MKIMREAIIACIALAFLTSPPHAEEGLGALGKGAAGGAASGAGGAVGGNKGGGGTTSHAVRGEHIPEVRIKPTTTKPTNLGSSQTKDRQ